MSAAAQVIAPPTKALLLFESRAVHEFGAFLGALPLLSFAPRGDGHSALVMPGLFASDVSTRPLRTFLKSRGYDVHGWGLGRNLGPRPGVAEGMLERIRHLRQKSGRKVSLIGWSLGGVYARQLAKQCPDDVRLVISLGSPFNGSPRANNAWRIYEYASGRRADERPMGPLPKPPPVPTTAIFSRTDGVCAWQCCVETAGPQVENIEVESSHCGLGHHPAVVYAVAERLAQAEGAWRPFERSGWRSLVYPDPNRSN
jgi:pimeloyl-ACP methyl ester carboxylesterase